MLPLYAKPRVLFQEVTFQNIFVMLQTLHVRDTVICIGYFEATRGYVNKHISPRSYFSHWRGCILGNMSQTLITLIKRVANTDHFCCRKKKDKA